MGTASPASPPRPEVTARTLSARLAGFGCGLRYGDIPAPVRADARLHLLDTLGVMLAAHALGECSSARAVAGELGGAEQATAIGLTARVPAASAALVNGMLAHALDYDDSHTPSVMHVSCVTVPTALSVGESIGVSGAECLTALVAGNEAATRLGRMGHGTYIPRGWHGSSVAGAFAAALTAGRLLYLREPQIVSALGIAGSQAAGSTEFIVDGTGTKPFNVGWAAHAGIMAAGLAANGLTGPASALGGEKGLFATYLGISPEQLDEGPVEDLGSVWDTSAMAFKPYPACHATHSSIDAVLHLMRSGGLVPEDIVSIRCRVPAYYVPLILEPLDGKRRPRSAHQARFSLPFCVAVAALRGDVGVDSFTSESIGDPAVHRLADTVTYEVGEFPEFPESLPGGIELRLRDGRTLQHTQRTNRGGLSDPLPPGDVVHKFRANASQVLEDPSVDGLVDAALGLGEDSSDVRRIMDLVAGRHS